MQTILFCVRTVVKNPHLLCGDMETNARKKAVVSTIPLFLWKGFKAKSHQKGIIILDIIPNICHD